MDCQVATALQLIELFKKVREERSELVADDGRYGDLVTKTKTAMHGIMDGIVSLTHGTNLATASQSETSLSAESTGTSVATLQETNNKAAITGPNSLLESSQFPALLAAAVQENSTPSILIRPGAPVRATTIRERTPLGLFRVIMMANTSFLADIITKSSSMLDCDSRKNLASTSSAMNNLVHRNINLKRPAAQDQETTSKKKVKKSKMSKKAKISWRLASED